MTQPTTRRPPARTRRTARLAATPPANADGCRCQPTTRSGVTQRWPVTVAEHLGHARYRIVRRHQAACGRAAEPLDIAIWRTG